MRMKLKPKSAAGRIATFVALLAAVFAAATVAGAAIDPSVETNGHNEEGDMSATGAHHPAEATNGRSTTGHDAAAAASVAGLAVAQDGYRLVPDRTTLRSGSGAVIGFRIVDAGGETVREFDTEHERRMHLIVIRRDFAGFQHLHPRQLGDGRWEAEADIEQAGVYRVFADFATGGTSLTLATDLFVPGPFQPRPLPVASSTAEAGDGYEVTIESGPGQAGEATPVRFAISHDGRELRSVEPYLGADGHLVALREHDQAFLHAHPEGEPGGAGPIVFQIHYPTPGRYRLFLQFKHEGVVHTAGFTQRVDAGGQARTDGH